MYHFLEYLFLPLSFAKPLCPQFELRILTTYVVADESPAMIAERLSNEEIMIWMREQNIFGV